MQRGKRAIALPSPPVPTARSPESAVDGRERGKVNKARSKEAPLPPTQPTQPDGTQTFVSEGGVTRKATVSGPVQVMLELSKQLLTFAETVTTALKTRLEPPPPRFLLAVSAEPTAVRDSIFLSPLMHRWLTGTAKAKVDL